MPLDKFVLIIVCVLIAAGLTVWLGAFVLAAVNVPFAGFALLPVALVAYVVWRVISERLGNAEEDHYDGMDH